VQLEAAFAAVSVQSLQEQTRVVLDNEEPSTLRRREGDEIGSGRGDKSSRLQGQTSAAKAATFA